MKQRTKIGDIFKVPLDEDRVSISQVVAKCGPIFYMVVFDFVVGPEEEFDLKEATNAPIILLGNFFDILIKNGTWEVIGNLKPDLQKIPFPIYKVVIDGQYYVESWDGKKSRPATAKEYEFLDRPNSNAAAYLEEAVKAHFGLIPQKPAYERFAFDYVKSRSRIPI